MSDTPENPVPPSNPPPQSPPPASPPPGSPPPDSAPLGPDAEQRQWAMFAHLSALIGGLLSSWLGGLGVFIGPLVIWLIKKDTMAFVDDQGKEALNFNITVAIACLALWLLVLVTFGIGLVIAIPLWVVIGVAWLVLTIVAGIKANEGQLYRYPFALRLIK